MTKKKYSSEEIDELKKSLADLEFSEDEINQMISKAESEEIEEEEEEEPSEDEMQKAYDNIMKMKTDLDNTLKSFLDKFGKVPGFKAPDFDVKNKSVGNDIEKSVKEDISKAFTGNFDMIQKSFEIQKEFNDDIMKSLNNISETVQKIAEAPNPFKSILGNYSVIEKGEKFSDDGKQVISLKDKKRVQDTLLKSLDVLKEEHQVQAIRDEISNFTVTNKLNQKSLDIVSKALNVEFEK